MLDTNYSVDILINDKPIRKYPFNNKLFVEARPGQEYSIRIKNNTWNRILTVASIDGLDVLTGKQAEESGTGYVINGYNSLNLDGFRVSNEKIAKFCFTYKEASYAASKDDGSERNVGVIGVRLFFEKIRPPTVVHHYHDSWWNRPYYGDPPICCSGLTSDNDTVGARGDSTLGNSNTSKGLAGNSMGGICSMADFSELDPRGFDMGTKFGKAKESRVVEVEFERGFLARSINIYYASRKSLIEMGVPLGSEKQVSFPEPFKDGKYSTPPKGWRG